MQPQTQKSIEVLFIFIFKEIEMCENDCLAWKKIFINSSDYETAGMYEYVYET